MKYYIIAGEASGDLHGSNLLKELRQLDTRAELRGWGGDLMEASGCTIVKHYRDLAFMGFAEVVKNLGTIFRNLDLCKKDITAFKPDVIILVDYPGFNLRIAKWAKQKGYTIIFYISPQVWAWKESRVRAMKKNIDKMLVILPFEKEYFKSKWNWEVEYVGHPLVQVIESWKKDHEAEENSNNVIALLPGSRKQEIEKKLPVMLETSKSFPQYRFVVAKAPSIDNTFYAGMMEAYPGVQTVENKTYELLNKSKAALVTSGTATLETALFGVPEVVCYKGSNISYQIAKRLIKIKFISLVNLIMDKMIVKELIQNELTAGNLSRELESLLHDEEKREQLQHDYRDLRNNLSGTGNASANAAKSIYTFIKRK